MTRRLITIAIDAEETTCGECEWRSWVTCTLHEALLHSTADSAGFLRLPECITAERKETET